VQERRGRKRSELFLCANGSVVPGTVGQSTRGGFREEVRQPSGSWEVVQGLGSRVEGAGSFVWQARVAG
jgi:hypothetical protein